MAEKIFITGAKGGVGATTCAFGVGAALAETGASVLIIDGDRLAAAGLEACGLANMQTYCLSDYERGACRAKQTLITHPQIPNLCVSAALNLKDCAAAENAVRELDGLFDYILADKICKGACDRAVIVTEPYPAAVKRADACACSLTDDGLKTELIVNKLNGGQIIEGNVPCAEEIAAILRLSLVGAIPEDLTLPLKKMKKGTYKAFCLTAAKIAGKGEKVTNPARGYFGPAGFIKRKLRGLV